MNGFGTRYLWGRSSRKQSGSNRSAVERRKKETEKQGVAQGKMSACKSSSLPSDSPSGPHRSFLRCIRKTQYNVLTNQVKARTAGWDRLSSHCIRGNIEGFSTIQRWPHLCFSKQSADVIRENGHERPWVVPDIKGAAPISESTMPCERMWIHTGG